jgi:hypothetical protein
MVWHEIWVTDTRKGETIEEEKAEDRENTYQNAVPQFAVHASFDGLFTLIEVLHREIKRV